MKTLMVSKHLRKRVMMQWKRKIVGKRLAEEKNCGPFRSNKTVAPFWTRVVGKLFTDCAATAQAAGQCFVLKLAQIAGKYLMKAHWSIGKSRPLIGR